MLASDFEAFDPGIIIAYNCVSKKLISDSSILI